MALFKRDAYAKLVEWKRRSNGATAMLIEGARRVGKSTLALEFAAAEYESYLLVDFSKVNDEFRQTFLDTRTDMDAFFLYLTAFFGVRLHKRKSLVIFDEVQLFPPAREFIKHLVADGRYDYLETGSLISLEENVADILIPSEEESMTLRPMTFDEFLEAMDEGALRDAIRVSFDGKKPLPEALHRKAERLFREYVLVGGMPQAVAAYAESRDMEAADRAKRLVLKLYRNDIAKYGGSQSKKIVTVFDGLPGQLSKHKKRLVYADVEEGARARDYENALAWLGEAGMVNLCYRATDPCVGLGLSRDDSSVKCYLADTGLLATLAYADNEEAPAAVYREVLLGRLEANQGMLAENVVAQQLAASGHALYFYSSYSPVAADRMEIDFLMTGPYPNAAMKPRVCPVEVKSGKRYKTTSLDKFKAKFGTRVGTQYILHPRPLSADGDRVFLPLYMSGLV